MKPKISYWDREYKNSGGYVKVTDATITNTRTCESKFVPLGKSRDLWHRGIKAGSDAEMCSIVLDDPEIPAVHSRMGITGGGHHTYTHIGREEEEWLAQDLSAKQELSKEDFKKYMEKVELSRCRCNYWSTNAEMQVEHYTIELDERNALFSAAKSLTDLCLNVVFHDIILVDPMPFKNKFHGLPEALQQKICDYVSCSGALNEKTEQAVLSRGVNCLSFAQNFPNTQHLVGAPNLTILDTDSTELAYSDWENIVKFCPQLELLAVAQKFPQQTGKRNCLEMILQGLPNLRLASFKRDLSPIDNQKIAENSQNLLVLDMAWNFEITDEQLSLLAKTASNLKVLSLNYIDMHKSAHVTAAGVISFLENNKSILQLSMAYVDNMQDCAKVILQHPTLKVVGTHYTLQKVIEKEREAMKIEKVVKFRDVKNYWWYSRMGKSVINNHGFFSPGIIIRKEQKDDDEDYII